MEYEPTDNQREWSDPAAEDREVESTWGGDGITCDTEGDYDLSDNEVSEETPITDVEFPHLRCGMEIADSPVRETLQERVDAARTSWLTSYGRQEVLHEANDIANSVDGVGGVEVVRPGDCREDYYNRCGQYAFGEHGGEEWAAPGEDLPNEFWWNPLDFLGQHGYLLVDTPRPGDIVGYSPDNPNYIGIPGTGFRHFGVMGGDGRVTSKFDQGPVAQHDIGTVPSGYGSFAYFFRKFAAPDLDDNNA